MARKRRVQKKMITRKRKPTNKRFMGAVNVSEIAGVVGGMIASKLIVNAAAKVFPKVATPIYKAMGQIVLGVVTKPLAGSLKIKSPLFDALGKGMIIGGSFELAKTLLPAALGQTDEEGDVIIVSGIDEMNGLDEIGAMDEIGMNDDINEINGYDEEDYSGY